jgi:hypothetical protein
MVIDIRQLLIWKAEQDLFLAWVDNRGYNISRAENRIVRIRQGIGFRYQTRKAGLWVN